MASMHTCVFKVKKKTRRELDLVYMGPVIISEKKKKRNARTRPSVHVLCNYF